MRIDLQPVEMTPEVMQVLEDRGLIIRLHPGKHAAAVGRNQSNSAVIYASEDRYGPHKLIVATINALEPFPNFGTHDDNEEFLLIGDPGTKPVYLIVGLEKKAELEKKIATGTLSAGDFVALHLRYNDPYVSFFTMLKDVPHGEVTVDGPGVPGSFYVTEPRDIVILSTDFGEYQVRVTPDGL